MVASLRPGQAASNSALERSALGRRPKYSCQLLFGNAETWPGDNAIESLGDCEELSGLKTMSGLTPPSGIERFAPPGRVIHGAAQSALSRRAVPGTANSSSRHDLQASCRCFAPKQNLDNRLAFGERGGRAAKIHCNHSRTRAGPDGNRTARRKARTQFY
jgi:hypothetical protein